MMKSWKLVVLTLLPSLLAASPALATEPPEAPTVYRFLGDRLPEPGGVTEARIEYEVNGRTIYTERFSLLVEAGGSATFPVPDPEALAAIAGADGKILLHVYAGDTLLDSFDAAGFRAYNARLQEVPSPGATESTGVLAPKALDPCVQACNQEYRQCIKAGHSGCDIDQYYCLANCPNYDTDGDGVLNGNDNCVFTSNANQANCDGDSAGNACDSLNANYQTITSEQTCWTDKDTHTLLYITFEHHVEWLERDMSSCGSPDRWRNRIRQDNDCVNISDSDCCWGLRHSISAVGDDPTYWCDFFRNVNFCQ